MLNPEGVLLKEPPPEPVIDGDTFPGVLVQNGLPVYVRVALGFEEIVTVTVATALGQGLIPGTVYVYVPAEFVAGLKVPKFPPLKTEGPVHVPFEAGLPPKIENKFTGEPDVQTVVVLLVPATAGATTVAVKVLISVYVSPTFTEPLLSVSQ